MFLLFFYLLGKNVTEKAALLSSMITPLRQLLQPGFDTQLWTSFQKGMVLIAMVNHMSCIVYRVVHVFFSGYHNPDYWLLKFPFICRTK